MDPLTALGAIAAASQLAEQGYNLIKFIKDVCSKVHEAPEASQRQLAQIEQVITLADLIKETPSLQKDDLLPVIDGCLARSRELLVVLQNLCVNENEGKWKRFKSSWSAVMKEKKVISQFRDLEQQKSLLALRIQAIDSTVLNTVHVKVDTISNYLEDISTNLQDLKLSFEQQAVASSSPQPSHQHYFVPNRHVHGFVGRQDVLAQIEAGFCSGDSPRIVVLRGLGGQGKTQIALQYCRQSKTKFGATFWADATSESTLQKAFSTISERIKAQRQVLQDSERVRFVIDSLQEWPDPWLMVLDNYDAPETFNNLQDFVPVGEHGCILVTSRHAASKALTEEHKAIELLGLPKADALELFFKQSQATETKSTVSKAEHIVDRLGYHALAIAQAGSYIRVQKIEVKDFMAHYDQQRRLIFEQIPQMTPYRKFLNNTEKETSMNVFTTWELSFQQLLSSEPTGHQKADILTLFAFFDSKDISEGLFGPFCKQSSHGLKDGEPGASLRIFLDADSQWKSSSFTETINTLTDMSLVQSWWREDDTRLCHLSLHPLVRDWIRLRTSDSACGPYSLVMARILAQLLRSCYSYGNYELSLPKKQVILSHISAHEENLTYFNEVRAHLTPDSVNLELYRAEEAFASFLRKGGHYEKAESTTRRGLEGREKILGPGHNETAYSVHQLGKVFFRQMKYEEASKMYRRALEACEMHCGSDHRNTFAALNNLALALNRQGKHDEAEKIIRQVLEGREKYFGLEDHSTFFSVSSLAKNLQAQGKYEEAESLFHRLLEGRKKVLGAEHPDTLNTIWSMASLFRCQNRFNDSLSLYQWACDSYQKVRGKEHPTTLKVLEDYSKFLGEIDGNDAESKALASQILEEGETVDYAPEQGHLPSRFHSII